MKDLTFLKEVAEENGLKYFTNEKGDMQIEGHNICFHLADLMSGEKDAVQRWQYFYDKNIRCVFVYPPYLENSNRVNVYKNIMLYHCGIRKKIFARNTVCKEYPAKQFKWFFEENNIEGYRNANKVYVLEDKKTGEPYMMYSIGHSYFGKGNYSCEIARGACRLGYQVVGGASKLWKHILEMNPEVNSIVYYVDRREYDGRSIGQLMESEASTGKVYQLKGCSSFMNYWIRDVNGDDGKPWHKAGEYKNREASRNSEVTAAYRRGDVIQVHNPGSYTNVYVKEGYHLEGMKVVKDEETND